MGKLRVAYNANQEQPVKAKTNKHEEEVQRFISDFLADHNEKINQKKNKTRRIPGKQPPTVP